MSETTVIEKPESPDFEAEFQQALDEIEVNLKVAGRSLSEACEAAGVARATPDRWNAKPPKSVELIAALQRVARGWREEVEAAKLKEQTQGDASGAQGANG